MASYDKGDIVRCTARFYDDTDTLVDPDAVKFLVKTPAGGTFTADATRVAAGIYAAEVEPTSDGVWHFRFEGAGTATGAAEGSFFVKAGSF